MTDSKTGLRQLGATEFNALEALGGVRGIAESVVPVLVFVMVLVGTSNDLMAALLGALAVCVGAILLRLLQRQPLTQALGGVVMVGLSAIWAWRSGTASNFYALGLWINAFWMAATVLSVVLGWPLVGVIVSTVRGEPMHWRTEKSCVGARRRYRWGTYALALMFGLRLAVELPLYLAGDSAATALGIARLVLGVPLFALTLWFIWLSVRSAPDCSAESKSAEQS